MTVTAKIKVKECSYGTILVIFIIFIKLQKLSECLENIYLSSYYIAWCIL